MEKETKEGLIAWLVIASGFVAIILLLWLLWLGISKTSIITSGWSGEAQLKQAEWNRQIAVREAQAHYDAAHLLAQAEVERAKGVALANKIIGDSLHNNEAYLRYLWINNLQSDHNKIIYVPTEANLPVLEAARLNKEK